MKRTIKSMASLFLCLVLLLCVFPTASVSAADKEVFVLAGSDFQVTDYVKGKNQVYAIVRRMARDGFKKFDGLMFCGDYTHALDQKVEDSVEGYTHLMDTLDPYVGDHRVFVKGNHEPKECEFLSPSGANDSEDYGTFVINENDFYWASNAYRPETRQAAAKATAANLKVYLDEKINSGYNKPVFVVSHVPLHYTYRTKLQGDGDQANFIFDVLNEAGKKLNIFFLFGHNHSNGWDDYLGGAAIYLKKGDPINIAQASMTEFKEETLNFTYMNAGYTGYYSNPNSAYNELTMTMFRIKGNEVLVARYSADGRVDLKAAGVRNSYKDEDGYAVNTAVYQSPRLVTLGGDVETVMPTTTKKTKTTTAASTTTKKATTTTKKTTVKATTTKATVGAAVTTTTNKATTTQADVVDTTSTTVLTTTVVGATTTKVQAGVTTTVLPDTDGSTEVLTTTTTTADAVITTPSTTLPSQSTGSEPESSPVLIIVIAAAAVLAAGAVVVIVLVRKKKTNV